MRKGTLPGTILASSVTGALLVVIVAPVLVLLLGSVVDTRLMGVSSEQWVKGSAVQSRSVQHEIHDIYRRHGALWMSGLLHFAAWIANSVSRPRAMRLSSAPS